MAFSSDSGNSVVSFGDQETGFSVRAIREPGPEKLGREEEGAGGHR